MIGPLRAICAGCLAVFAAGPAMAEPTTQIIVHVDQRIHRSRLTIEFEGQAPIAFQDPARQDQFYRNYNYVLRWPAGGRNRRNDFELFAKIQDSRSNAYYLRLRPSSVPVEIYVFDPQVSECQWMNLRVPETPDDIFQQLATAEAMLMITSPRGRCSVQNLQRWTELWLNRVNLLWRRNQFVRLNPHLVEAIQGAYNTPRPHLLVLRRTLPLPPGFHQAIALDRELSAKFN